MFGVLDVLTSGFGVKLDEATISLMRKAQGTKVLIYSIDDSLLIKPPLELCSECCQAAEDLKSDKRTIRDYPGARASRTRGASPGEFKQSFPR